MFFGGRDRGGPSEMEELTVVWECQSSVEKSKQEQLEYLPTSSTFMYGVSGGGARP